MPVKTTLAEQAKSLLAAKNYGEALGVLRKLMSLEPGHPFAGFYQMLLRSELLKSQGLPAIGPELAKTFERKLQEGFFKRWLAGPNILDIGYKGSFYDSVPVLPHAVGVDLDTPGYDGLTLPFANESQDGVFACHCLEHMPDLAASLQEWMRVLRVGGHLVVIVPHQHLYEKRLSLPSLWNSDHKHFLTPARLLAAVEEALPVNGYRLRHLEDNDYAYDYSIGPARHAVGCYEIEMVLEKLPPPNWALI